MPQAIVDPDELRRFARNLQQFDTELRERSAALGAQLANLAKTWRDQEHSRFTEEFEEQMRGVSRLLEMNEQHIPYLLRKAEIIEQYLQQR